MDNAKELYIRIKPVLLPDDLEWAREIAGRENSQGLYFAVRCANLLKIFATIYCDDSMTAGEKESAYLDACELIDTKHRVDVVHYKNLLERFKQEVNIHE
jgi:hypothetical protein